MVCRRSIGYHSIKQCITLQRAQSEFAIIKKKIWCKIYVNAMSQNEIVYLKYQNLEDLLKVIIYSAQSMLGVIPMLYYIHYNSKHVLFRQTGAVGGTTVHYAEATEAPSKRYIQRLRLSREF